MEEGGEKGEEQSVEKQTAIRPELMIPKDQVILDYDDDTHRREIKHLLYRHFGEGRTVAADLLRIISSPGANPQVMNLHESHISSHCAHYSRWDKEKKEGIVVVDGDVEPKDDTDEYQEQLDKLTLAVGKMGQNVQDLQETMKVRDGITAAGDVEPPDVPRITEEELRSKVKELYPGEDMSFHPLRVDLHIAPFHVISRFDSHRLPNDLRNNDSSVRIDLYGMGTSSAFEEDNPITLLIDFYYANTKYDDDIPRVVMGLDNGVAECPQLGSSRHHNDPIRALDLLKYVTPSILLHPVHRAIVSRSTQKTPSDTIEGHHPRDTIARMVNYGVGS